MKCKSCGSEKLISPYGNYMKFGQIVVRTYRCTVCGKTTTIKEKVK